MDLDWQAIKKEVTGYLQQLIRIDTSKPEGNELEAILYLKELAESNGLSTKVQITAPGRGNIIISRKSRFSKNPIILLSHVDVVPAHPQDWKVPPFSGKIIDQEIWGRGTVDTKQLTITHLMILILQQRQQIDLKRPVMMIATSDEETGSRFGLLALLEKYPEIFHGALVFNEGGGFPIVVGKTPYYLIEMGQKGVAKITITVPQQPSPNPYMPNSHAIHTATQIIHRIQHLQPIGLLPNSTQALLEKINKDRKSLSHSHLRMMKAMSGTTMSVTRWQGGRKHPETTGDVILTVDCRPVPGVTQQDIENVLHDLVQGTTARFTIDQFSEGYETELDEEVQTLIQTALEKELPQALAVPFLSIGGSDGRYVVPNGGQVIGYCPVLPDLTYDKAIQLVHGVNERLPLESLRFGLENMWHIINELVRSEHYEFNHHLSRA